MLRFEKGSGVSWISQAAHPERVSLPFHRRSLIRCGATFHILQYQYVPDILEKRGPHREQHLEAAQQAVNQGKVLMAGAAGDPVDQALFIWKDSTTEDLQAFVANDVYVKAGLVLSHSIKPYHVAVKADNL